MTRPSRREIEREFDELEQQDDNLEFNGILFVDGDGEVWGRATEDGIEPADPDQYEDDEITVLADFTGELDDS